MLEGFRSRDAGVVSVLGMDPSDRACQRTLPERLGVVVQDLAVEPFLSVEEVLSRSASYYLNPCDVGEVIRSVGLEEKATTRVKSLSGGQQRRLDLGLGVTSLTAEAVSFFSRSLVGCEKGRSSPEDVAGGVFVGVGVVPAADAFEHRLCNAVLPGCVPAGFAAVGAVPGVHADHLPPSFFRFGCKDRAEVCPAGVGDACVQPGLGRRTIGQEGSGEVWVRVGLGPGGHVVARQHQHPLAAFASDLDRLHPSSTCRCALTVTSPTPWRYTWPVSGLKRHPSPSAGHSTLS